MRLGELCCKAMADWFRRRNLLDMFYGHDGITQELYYDILYKDADRSYSFFKDVVSIKDKDILDMGCGMGAKTVYYVANGARSAVGTDISVKTLVKARKLTAERYPGLADRVTYEQCTDRGLPFAKESFDVVILDSVFEHLEYAQEVLKACWDVTRKGGYICIDFQPWWGAHGPHVDNLIPVPWCHLIFSEKTLMRVCADIYDSGNYRQAFWDFDEVTGERRPNKWRNSDRLPDLNYMTISRFKRLIKKSGYPVDYFKLHGYENSNRKFAKMISRMVKPIMSAYPLNEVFTSALVCVIKKD